MEGLIRQRVRIDVMQFGFKPGIDTTDTIFILRYIQKYLAADMEKSIRHSSKRCHVNSVAQAGNQRATGSFYVKGC